MDDTPTQDTFHIIFKDKPYPCKRVEKPQAVFYAVKFDTRILLLTKFISNNEFFWTAIPADEKLNHIVKELGTQIDNHLKKK